MPLMLNKIYRVFAMSLRKEGVILVVSLVIGLLFATGVAAYSYIYAQTTQRNIADNVIRFHVRANSDSSADQAIKESLRLEILSELEDVLAVSTCINETRDILEGKLCKITSFAEEFLRDSGFNYPVTSSMAQVFFPTMVYGNIAFPPGEYEAVQILIGEGTGSNWWCLMFPPLCYVDMTATEEGRQQLADTVSDESFRLLMHQYEESRSLTVRFRIVEWWQNRNRPQDTQRYELIQG